MQTQTFELFYFVFKHLKTILMQLQYILHIQHLQVHCRMLFLCHKIFFAEIFALVEQEKHSPSLKLMNVPPLAASEVLVYLDNLSQENSDSYFST